MMNKLIRPLLVIFTLTLALVFGIYALDKIPGVWCIVIGITMIMIHGIIIPIWKIVPGDLNTITKTQLMHLKNLGFKPEHSRITYAEAFQWLREEKKIFVYPSRYEYEGGGFMFSVRHECEPNWEAIQYDGPFDKWDDMELEALYQAIVLTDKIYNIK